MKNGFGGASVAQVVKCPTSAQITISWLVGSSPEFFIGLSAVSLELTPDTLSPSLSTPPLLAFSLSLSKENKHLKNPFCK